MVIIATYFYSKSVNSHAGFDIKAGKYLSAGGIENTAIVSKSQNFDLKERNENGYIWTEKHKERVPFKLKSGCTFGNKVFFIIQLFFIQLMVIKLILDYQRIIKKLD